MNSPHNTAAFFDLDKTLLARSSGELYIRVLREQGLVSNWELAKILTTTALYGLNLLRPEWLMERAASWYEGGTEQEMVDFCRDWFDRTVKDYLYTDAIRRIREHQARGHIVALLTAATSYIAGPTGHYLGVPHLLCTRLDVREGRFTGRLLKPLCHGKGKLYWAIEFCKAHGADLEKSYFYTDSIRDLPALEAVGNPRPVNTDRRLLRVARRRGWPVEHFRTTLGKVDTDRRPFFFGRGNRFG
jgi:putative phosphoserine phosphatase/1-acylglycerol-3-phosphate O-acyltransferase